ncbi:hypothetical protein B0J12DRAFT_705012 [Macrophomina phaseolina]|uniref:Uncharacterized protein n=1 Tax=Macrophomina phaseolina TaxID=35725 RepID=A0ABQ8FTI2_9PEZI|nr:hypothetical protein B0J12DRAFT_705012 [Macrophomina phaseolina]
MSSVSVNKWSPSTTTKSRVSSGSFFTSPAKSSRKVASCANEYQPTENTSMSEDDSIAQQDPSTKTGKNSHQDPRADTDRADNYGLLATRLASTATHDEINSIQARIEELKARKETAEDVLEQANKEATKQSEQAKEDISEKPKLVVAISSLKSIELDDFVNNTWWDCNSYPHAIDVLVGNACYFWQLEPEPARDHADLSVVPERIPINSRPLLTFLTKPINKNDGKTYSHVVLRPYKILLQHESSIRQRAEELVRKWGRLAAIDDGACEGAEHLGRDAKDQISKPATVSEELPEAAAAQPPQADGNSYSEKGDDSEKGVDRLNDSVEAWKEFVCLTNFVDRCILPVARNFGDEVQKACFQDLWHLFKPGDDILVNKADRRAGRGTEKYAVWRVFHVTEGRPLLSSGGILNPLFLGTRDKTSQFAVGA